MAKYFISGIDTEIGKTVVSAILTQALQADYWKPVQSGELDHSDTHKVRALVSCSSNTYFPETYRLNKPMSPHASANADGVSIALDQFELPETNNNLIVEGAGGLLVPLNEKDMIIDLIKNLNLEVILVSKHRLGNINHTLLSIEALQNRTIPIKGIIFNGEEIPETESIISKLGKVPILGTIPTFATVDQQSIVEEAKNWSYLS